MKLISLSSIPIDKFCVINLDVFDDVNVYSEAFDLKDSLRDNFFFDLTLTLRELFF
jgi:CRISPR/Cas system-associated exonuclease Cas4 (RecB family)